MMILGRPSVLRQGAPFVYLEQVVSNKGLSSSEDTQRHRGFGFQGPLAQRLGVGREEW
jgi:hypothetical protein